MDGRRCRQDHHLHAARRRQVHVGQSAARRGRGLFLEARRGAQQGAGLHPDAARLDAGKLRHHGQGRRQQGRAQICRRFLVGLRAQRAGGASGLGGRRGDGAGQRGRRRHGQCLAQGQFGRHRPVRAESVPTGRDHQPRSQPGLFPRRACDQGRHHPACRRGRHAAAAAGIGRRRHRQEPDPRPDRRPRRQGQRQGRDLSAGGRALPELQPEGQRRCSRKPSGKPPATWSTTRA